MLWVLGLYQISEDVLHYRQKVLVLLRAQGNLSSDLVRKEVEEVFSLRVVLKDSSSYPHVLLNIT